MTNEAAPGSTVEVIGGDGLIPDALAGKMPAEVTSSGEQGPEAQREQGLLTDPHSLFQSVIHKISQIYELAVNHLG
ncbi:MAG TPA: hypothetical protein VFT87_02275 [Candidatus Saccharimonadales bacterium]|nr:hypothetical protein [Candidatus Saccharimonadales bacterium]